MTFEELLNKHFSAVETVVKTGNDRFESPDTATTWLALRKALEADLSDLPEGKRQAAVRMAAIELVSMMLYPEGGGAVEEGGIAGDIDSNQNPDIDAQMDMEMPDTAETFTGGRMVITGRV